MCAKNNAANYTHTHTRCDAVRVDIQCETDELAFYWSLWGHQAAAADIVIVFGSGNREKRRQYEAMKTVN